MNDTYERIIQAHYPTRKILSKTEKTVAIKVTEYALEGGIFVYSSPVGTIVRRKDGKPFPEVLEP